MICRLICKQHVCIGGTFDKCYTIFKEQIYFDNMFILCYTICKKHIYVIVVPDICCPRNPTTCTCFMFVCSTTGPMSLPDMVCNFKVPWYNGIIKVLWLCIMIMFQLRHHREPWTACRSQLSVMATWQIGVGGGPDLTAAHSARQDGARQLFTQ